MASSLARISSRVAGAPLRRHVLTRGFQSTATSNAATPFTMPAMSPTMTEGSISSWKVKEGESFSAGDVLMEIETDKAQMDVEAQEDGIMAKIFTPSGSKGVPVGKRIAVLAEPEDDIKTLEIPPEDAPSTSAASESPKQDVTSQPASTESQSTESSTASTPQHSSKTPQHPSPSVISLLHAASVPSSKIPEIPATGPKGRLLKGDVLAYLGKINKSYPSELSSRISTLSKLDLSNIKIAPLKKPAAAEQQKKAELPKEAELSVEVVFDKVLAVQARVRQALGVHLPLSQFIEKATAMANSELPPSRGAVDTDALFNEILGLPAGATVSGGSFAPVIRPAEVFETTSSRGDVDIYDLLTMGNVQKVESVAPTEGIAVRGVNMVSVTVPISEEERARVFLGRVKGFLEEEPGRLVL